MRADNIKRRTMAAVAVVLNIILVISVVISVFQASNNAKQASFAQNIDNVRTLTNASANKVHLEFFHNTQKLKTAADYINEFDGRGMTEDEIYAYFEIISRDRESVCSWELVDNCLNDKAGVSSGFNAVALSDGHSSMFSYSTQVYSELAKIFISASNDTIGKYNYSNEFTDPSPMLEKSSAIATTVRIYTAGKPYQYKTLMLLINSDYINELLSQNNEVDAMEYFDYANVIINDNGDYVISNSYFQGTNIFEYLKLYNDDFTKEDSDEIIAKLSSENYSDTLYYKNSKYKKCAYTIVPVQNSNRHILSIVPIDSFHVSYNYNRNFMNFAILFGLLFLTDIIFVIIINRRLKYRTKEAEAANLSKSVFLSSMSHDIRTPMNAIIGMTIIASKQLDEEPIDKATVKDCMHSIELSGNHLLTLINDILDISKIESGKILLHTSDFSIADTVSNVIEMCQSRIVEKEFLFEAHIQNVSHEYVTGDSLRINQIFTNILTNAIKYTEPKGRITVRLTENLSSKDGYSEYVYTVSDNGIGMSSEFVKTIFDRFSRAVDTRINSVQGTGLGMSIVKQLVDLMGGTIEVESELNVGSTFTVTLALPVVPQELEQPKYDSLSVLLIDDDEILLQTLKMSLSEMGISVDTARGGSEGIEIASSYALNKHPYNIVFVDWKMDNISGIDVIHQLRSKLGNDIRIVVMTAYTLSEIEREARKAGADYFVTKPLFKSKLISTLNNVLNGNKKSKKSESLSFQGLHILVAEDNETNWKVLSRILKYYDISCERASNGKIAVEMVSETTKPYDMIFMDIQMPEMNGYQATTAIRLLNDKTKANLPIYAMTADTFADDVEKCKIAGMNGHLSKPVEISKITELLKKIYDEKY